ncbi:MAG: hypothetical protein ACSHYA_01075 [Opitutaceae bacterium]
MSDLKNDSQKEVKVEDLLRLKRAERPDDAFWGDFDQELHQRMLQTLVKKDPLHLQIWRTLSGRFTQSLGVACAAVFLGLMVVRPAFIGTTTAEISSVASVEAVATTEAVVVEVAMSDLDDSALEATTDYSIEGISADVESQDATFTRDFAMDGFQLALDADYSSDVASARPSFGSTGVATTLVY